MTDIVKYHSELPLLVNPDGAVEVRIGTVSDEDGQKSSAKAMFLCVSCEAPMHRSRRSGLFECQECGYEIDRYEAARICDRYIALVNELSSGLPTKEGWLCRLLMFLGLRKRPI